MERKWTYRKDHVHYNDDVAHEDMKMYWKKNQFPAVPFCGPHSKPHGARGLSKHYYLRFDPKLGKGVCAIFCIPRACVAWTSMLDSPWISGIPPDIKESYKPITNCMYWPLLGQLNNWKWRRT